MSFEIIVLALIILLGIIFLLAEIFLLPGLTVSGIAGFMFLAGGITYAYISLGAMAGNLSLLISIFLLMGSFLYFIRSKSLKIISLNTNIDSKVDTSDLQKIKTGDIGTTQSRLNPIGKVYINNLTVEAKSINGEMIEEDTEVIVKKVERTNILVAIKEATPN